MVGDCGLSAYDAAMCSSREIRLRREGRTRAMQAEWERERWSVWMMLSPNYKRGQAPKSPQALVTFPWEKRKVEDVLKAYQRTRVSKAESEALNRLFDKLKANQYEQDR